MFTPGLIIDLTGLEEASHWDYLSVLGQGSLCWLSACMNDLITRLTCLCFSLDGTGPPLAFFQLLRRPDWLISDYWKTWPIILQNRLIGVVVQRTALSRGMLAEIPQFDLLPFYSEGGLCAWAFVPAAPNCPPCDIICPVTRAKASKGHSRLSTCCLGASEVLLLYGCSQSDIWVYNAIWRLEVALEKRKTERYFVRSCMKKLRNLLTVGAIFKIIPFHCLTGQKGSNSQTTGPSTQLESWPAGFNILDNSWFSKFCWKCS